MQLVFGVVKRKEKLFFNISKTELKDKIKSGNKEVG